MVDQVEQWVAPRRTDVRMLGHVGLHGNRRGWLEEVAEAANEIMQDRIDICIPHERALLQIVELVEKAASTNRQSALGTSAVLNSLWAPDRPSARPQLMKWTIGSMPAAATSGLAAR